MRANRPFVMYTPHWCITRVCREWWEKPCKAKNMQKVHASAVSLDNTTVTFNVRLIFPRGHRWRQTRRRSQSEHTDIRMHAPASMNCIPVRFIHWILAQSQEQCALLCCILFATALLSQCVNVTHTPLPLLRHCGRSIELVNKQAEQTKAVTVG